MKENAVPKKVEGDSNAPMKRTFSDADKQDRKKLRAQVKKMGLHVVTGVVIFLISVLIAALANFFYGETREAKNALTLEKERNQRLERDLADLTRLQRDGNSELATVKAALNSEREKRSSTEAHNADLSKRIAKLTESLALVQQVLVAPDATLTKAKQALAERRKRHDANMTGSDIAKHLTGDDLSFLLAIFDAPGQLESHRELTAATVQAYESRIQTVDSIVRSALAAEKYLSPRPAPGDSPSPQN